MKENYNIEETITRVLDAIEKECEKLQKKDPSISFNSKNSEKFIQIFKDHYAEIINRFMKDTEELDSHKQAAIIVISCLESELIKADAPEGKINIAPQFVAVAVAISYMNDILQRKLEEKKIKLKTPDYIIPTSISCDTPYLEVVCRILYYEQNEKDMNFNVLELADRFFLMEYINLIQHGIEPVLLKEKE